MIVVQTILRGWVTAHSWFYSDDFLFLSDIGHGDDNFVWYFRFHFSHFMPLSFVLVKFASLFGAFNWTAAAILIIVMQVLVALTCWWMLRTLFGNRPGILIPLAFFLLSPMTLAANTWWAVAINQLPHLIAFFGAVTCHVLYMRHRRMRHAFATVAFMTLGYATYTKTMLLPVVLVLIAVFYFAEGPPLTRLTMAVRRFWKAWLLYGLVTATYVISYFARAPSGGSTTPSGKFIDLSVGMLVQTTVPTIFGGPLNWGAWTYPVTVARPSDFVIVLSWLLLSATIGYLAMTRERVLRALLIPFVYLGISLILIYVGRFYIINFIGVENIFRHMQYLTDLAATIALSIGLMCFPLIGSVESSAPRQRPLVILRIHPLVAGVVFLVILSGYAVSSIRYAEPWDSAFPQRSFFQTALDDLSTDTSQLAETPLPAIGISPFLYPHNLPSYAFAPVLPDGSTSDVGNDLKVFDEDGSILPALLDGPIRTKADSSKTCPIRVKNITTTIPFVPVFNYPFWMAIEYTSNADAHIPLDYGIFRKDVPIENGSHTLFIATTGAYDSVTLRPLVGQQICVKSIKVGTLIPQAAP